MNKMKVTAKAIRENGTKHICLGYCEAAHLLRNHEPLYYTCGVYGWNFDAYLFYEAHEAITICTGYRGMVGSRPSVSVEPYEKVASKIWSDYSRPYEERKTEVEKLLLDWLTACMKED